MRGNSPHARWRAVSVHRYHGLVVRPLEVRPHRAADAEVVSDQKPHRSTARLGGRYAPLAALRLSRLVSGFWRRRTASLRCGSIEKDRA